MEEWKVVATAVTFARASAEPIERLKAAGCQVITNPYGRPYTEQELVAAVRDADALIVGNDKVTESVIRAGKRLKVIAKHGVGYNNIDRRAAAECGVLVTNAPGSNSQAVADLAFGLLHMLARGLQIATETTKQGKWVKPMGMTLWEKTIGIIGLGQIGLAAAARATGYHMEILGYDVAPRPEALQLGVKYVSLEELLQRSDFITLHCPLTKDTENLLNAERLGLLRPGAILINTARYELVDAEAVYEALKSGRIGGYGLDVYPSEPPAHHPMFDLPNVVLTPHLGGTSRESNIQMGNTAVDNVLAVKAGCVPPNLIRPES